MLFNTNTYETFTHGGLIMSQCHRIQTNIKPAVLVEARFSFIEWGYPVNTKHLYNIYTTSASTSSTLDQHCINVIQKFCVYWVRLVTVHVMRGTIY